jgi:hypothetical protein
MAGPSHRRALGALFLVLAVAFAGVAFAAFQAEREAAGWVIGLAASALALWLGSLAVRALWR